MTVTDEITTMRRLATILDGLDEKTRKRVLMYLFDRYVEASKLAADES